MTHHHRYPQKAVPTSIYFYSRFPSASKVPAKFNSNPWSFIELLDIRFGGGIKGNGTKLRDELKNPVTLSQQASRRPGGLGVDLTGFRGNIIWGITVRQLQSRPWKILLHPPGQADSGGHVEVRGVNGGQREERSHHRSKVPVSTDLAADGATEWGQTPGLALNCSAAKNLPREENELETVAALRKNSLWRGWGPGGQHFTARSKHDVYSYSHNVCLQRG